MCTVKAVRLTIPGNQNSTRVVKRKTKVKKKKKVFRQLISCFIKMKYEDIQKFGYDKNRVL